LEHQRGNYEQYVRHIESRFKSCYAHYVFSSPIPTRPTRMKNANIFVDVDLTLVDANGKPFDGAREALQRLRDEGCHLFLWSTAGPDYCRKVAHLNNLTEFFEGITAKPDILIDDMPSTCVTQFIYDVRQESSWGALAERIIDRHID
jgi:hypothetical protein